MPIDRPDRLAVTKGDALAELDRLREDLARMRLYASVLEERCNRLWRYVPDTHGARDPILPFLALHCHVGTLDHEPID
jgi:hypothetical protein